MRKLKLILIILLLIDDNNNNNNNNNNNIDTGKSILIKGDNDELNKKRRIN